MSRPAGHEKTELEIARQRLTKHRSSIKRIAEKYRESTAERMQIIKELEAQIAELEAQETA